jgi:ubiquinone/menaquinone biosynthesis C-methylase UbiE
MGEVSMDEYIREFIQRQRVLGQAQLTHFDPTDAEHQEHLSRYIFAAERLRAPCRVLDIACGIGYGSRYLADSAPGISVVGIDISEQAVDYAQSHYASEDVAFEVGDGTKLPFVEEEFDVVTSFETVEHVPDYELFLAELRRVLKPGGTLMMSTPNREFTNPLGSVQSAPPSTHHIHEWRLSEFRPLLSRYFEGIDWHSQLPARWPSIEKAFIIARRPLAVLAPSLRSAWIWWHRQRAVGAGRTEEGLLALRGRLAVFPWDDRHPGRIIVAVARKKLSEGARICAVK